MAGISIGSILSGLALAIAVLLFRIARSRRTMVGKKDNNGCWPRRRHNFQDTHEIGGGAYYEISGVAEPTELQVMSRAERGLRSSDPVGFCSRAVIVRLTR